MASQEMLQVLLQIIVLIEHLKKGMNLMVTKDILLEAIYLTKNNYYKNVVKKNGKYIYSYLPEENKKKKKNRKRNF